MERGTAYSWEAIPRVIFKIHRKEKGFIYLDILYLIKCSHELYFMWSFQNLYGT